jgi:23S rRNA (uracil1939-C5)-methyltransferase
MASPEPPVALRIERIGIDGDGIATWDGKPVYVPFTAPGDEIAAILGPGRGNGHRARVVALLRRGAARVEPPCRHFQRCGGCALQHLERETYRRTKLDGLQIALQRVGIDRQLVIPLRTVPPGRRRARFGLMRPRDPRQPGKVGFRERFRHDLVDLCECLVLEPPLFALAAALRPIVPELLAPGGRAEAILTRTDSGVELLVAAADRPSLAALEALAQLAAGRDLARVVWQSSAAAIPVVERRPVRMMRSGIEVPFPPGAFLQASESAEKILLREVTAAIGGTRPAIDLYAGLGTFGFALAAAGPVHLVEGDKATASALGQAARNRAGVTVERRDLARDPVPPDRLANYVAAVFDPPRAGAARQAEALARSPVATVVAVSCNPATFARDAAILVAGGLRIERVVAVDQFVWSPHLEIVAVFRR